MIIDVYESVDADVLSAAIRFQFVFFSVPNPPEHRDSVVSQMIDVAEVESCGFTRIFTEFAVLFANDFVSYMNPIQFKRAHIPERKIRFRTFFERNK